MCDPCLAEDCGECVYCLDKPRFGGPNKKKCACTKRRCVSLITTIHPKVTIKIPNVAAKMKRRRRPALPPSLSPAKLVNTETKYLVPMALKSPSKKVIKKKKVNIPKIPKFKVTVFLYLTVLQHG